jgi:hypothetical protein
MSTLQVSFGHKLNSSLQVGDTTWIATVDAQTGVTGAHEKLGVVTDIQGSNITVETSGSPIYEAGMFLFFSKPIEANESSLKGYYADVTLENSSHTYAELFAISSEVAPSSK